MPKCRKLVRQSELTWAMGRHALVDLSQVSFVKSGIVPDRRLTPEARCRLFSDLKGSSCIFGSEDEFWKRLETLASEYEPISAALADRLRLQLPRWVKLEEDIDNWQSGIQDGHI